MAQVCVAAGQEPDATLLSQLSDEHRQLKAKPFEAIEPEIVAMLTALVEAGYKLGVVTNASNTDAAPGKGAR